MAQEKNWSFEINGQKHEVHIVFNNFSGKHKLTVDGQLVPLKIPFKANFVGLDHQFVVDGEPLHLVVIGNSKADLAVNDYFIDSKQPYKPLNKMPIWAWLFIGASIAIPIVSLGGGIPVVLAFAGSVVSARVASSNKSIVTKLLLCTITVGLCWAAFFLVASLVASL